MDKKNLHKGHRKRMRHRFFETGFSGFQNHEIIEMLLFYARPQVNTNDHAHDLINKFGSISAILDADRSELESINGISTSASAFIKLMCDLCRNYKFSVNQTIKFKSSDDIKKYSTCYFAESNSQNIIIISLGSDMELLNTVGLPDCNNADNDILVSSIAEIALTNKLHRIVISCNRPGKPAQPEKSDYIILRKLMDILTHLNIEIYDYIICSGANTFSMRKNGAFSFDWERLNYE